MKPYVIVGDLLWPSGEIKPGVLSLEGNTIRALSETDPANPDPTFVEANVIEVAPGGVAAPGFIDLQLNGAFGHDFTRSPRQIAAVARHLPRFGVTAFLPTVISTPLEQYTWAASAAREVVRESGAAQMLGLHFEGPYLSPSKAGAHSLQYLRRPAIDELSYIDAEVVRLVTLAPELPGALAFIQALVAESICVGIGHSAATYEQCLAAAEAGATWGTHVFNAMSPLHHRHPGIVGALLADERLRLALIADGVHVHPALLRVVAAAKGGTAVTLITDGMAAVGMPEGAYFLGDQQVTVAAGSVRLANGTLAGSRLTLDQAVRNMVRLAGRPLAEALQMAGRAPAEVLGLASKGQLAPGYDADIVLVDQDLNIALTMIQGEVVYQATG